MLLAVIALIVGLILLVWSADKFVDGAAATARYAGMPPLLIGMLIVGFGTSAPEMVVSAMAAADGNPALALGNAYGSNITNIALILGVGWLARRVIGQRMRLDLQSGRTQRLEERLLGRNHFRGRRRASSGLSLRRSRSMSSWR